MMLESGHRAIGLSSDLEITEVLNVHRLGVLLNRSMAKSLDDQSSDDPIARSPDFQISRFSSA
jgi:hypothetical protein